MHIKSIVSITILTCSIVNPHFSVAMEPQKIERKDDTSLATQQSPIPLKKQDPSTKKEKSKPTPPTAPPVIEDPKTMQALEKIHELNISKNHPISDDEFREFVRKTLDKESELIRQEGRDGLTRTIVFNAIKCEYSRMKNNALSNRSWNRLFVFSPTITCAWFIARVVPSFGPPKKEKNTSVPVTKDENESKAPISALTQTLIGADNKKNNDDKRTLIYAAELGFSAIVGLSLGFLLDKTTQYINDEWSKSTKIENETKPWSDQTARINKAMQALSVKDSENIVTEAKRLTTEYMKQHPNRIKLVQKDDGKIYIIRDGKH